MIVADAPRVKADVLARYTLAYAQFIEELSKIELDTGLPYPFLSELAKPDVLYETVGRKGEEDLVELVKMNFRLWPQLKKLQNPFAIGAGERLKVVVSLKKQLKSYL